MQESPDLMGGIERNGAGEVGARNIRNYKRLVAYGLNTGNMALLEELAWPELIEHQDYGPGFPPGRDGVQALEMALRTALPDMFSVIEEIIAVDDQTWCRIRSTGTFTGPYLGIPPTGKPIDIYILESVRWVDGKVAEHWGVADRFGLMQDMSLIPPEAVPSWRPEFFKELAGSISFEPSGVPA